jgi:hypothetical protein
VAALDTGGQLIASKTGIQDETHGMGVVAADTLGNVFFGSEVYYIDYNVDDDVRDMLVTKISVPVPEPSTTLIAAGMLLSAGLVWRRRCRFRHLQGQ